MTHTLSLGTRHGWLVISILFLVLACTPPASAVLISNPDDLVELQVSNPEPYIRYANDPVVGGIALPRGQVASANLGNVRVLVGNGNNDYTVIPSAFTPMNAWPDGSHKWVQYDFELQNDIPANGTATYYLYYGATPIPSVDLPTANQITLVDGSTETIITTDNDSSASNGNFTFVIDKTKTSLFKRVTVNQQDVWPTNTTTRGFFLEDVAGVSFSTLNTPTSVQILENTSMSAVVEVRGYFKNAALQNHLSYILRYRFHAKGQVDLSFVTENRGQKVSNPLISTTKRFKYLKFVSDYALPGTKSLQLSEHKSISNFIAQSYALSQDFLPPYIDQMWPITLTGFNSDTSLFNQLDNFRLRIRDDTGTLVHNTGGTSLPYPTSPSAPMPSTPGSMAQGGLFHVSNSTHGFASTFQHFWQLSPKGYGISPTTWEMDLMATDPTLNGTTYDDIVHDRGPVNRRYTTNTASPDYGKYSTDQQRMCNDPTIAACDTVVQEDTQAFNLLIARTLIHHFSLFFDPTLTDQQLIDKAGTADGPLIALPPAWYWGPCGGNGVACPSPGKSAKVMADWYIEARNWNNESSFTATEKLIAIQSDKWQRAIWDQASTCASAPNSTGTCVSLVERGNRASASGSSSSPDAPKSHFGDFGRFGEFSWAGSDPDRGAYDLGAGNMESAMRNRDPRPLYKMYPYTWGIYATSRFDTLSQLPSGGPKIYQKGSWDLGQGASHRHSVFIGDILFALLRNDRDMMESVRLGSYQRAGNYPLNSLTQAMNATPWLNINGVGYKGKVLQDMYYYYQLTGDPNYITIAKGYLSHARLVSLGCHNRFGVWVFLEIDNHSTTDELNCVLWGVTGNSNSFSGDLYAGGQYFMTGYLTDGITRILEADKEINGQYDPVLYPWFVTVLQYYHSQLIHPFVPVQNSTTAYPIQKFPNNFFVYNSAVAPSSQQADNMCNGFDPNGPYNPQFINFPFLTMVPINNGSQFLIFCNAKYFNQGLIFYSFIPLSWLYHQTGDSQVLADMKIFWRDGAFLEQSGLDNGSGAFNLNNLTTPPSTPTFRNGGWYSSEIKEVGPRTWLLEPILAAMLYPPSNSVSTPVIYGISPPAANVGSSVTITLTGSNFPPNATISVGSVSGIVPSSPISSTSATFTLTSTQTTSLGAGVHAVVISTSSLASLPFNFTLNAVSSGPPGMGNYSPPDNTSFLQGSVVPISATVTNPASGQPVNLQLNIQEPGQSSATTVYSTTLTPGTGGATFSYNYALSANAPVGNYDWQIIATTSGGTTNSPVNHFTVTQATSNAPSIQALAPLPNVSIPIGSNVTFSVFIQNPNSSEVLNVYLSTYQGGSTTPIITALPNTTATPGGITYSQTFLLPLSTPLGTYTWQIGVVNANNPALNAVTPLQSFTVISSSCGNPVLCPVQAGVCNGSVEACVGGVSQACTTSSYPSTYQPIESTCGDGVDNDCDGLTDCSDSSCTGALACSSCGNGICENTETCSICAVDCTCQNQTTGGNTGSGGGGGGGGGSGSGGPRNLPAFGSDAPDQTIDESSNGVVENVNDPVSSNGSSLTNLLESVGRPIVSALSSDAAESYTTNVVAGIVTLLVMFSLLAYFFGLI